MKKLMVAMVAVLTVASVAKADLLPWDWATETGTKVPTVAPTGSPVFGNGTGWFVEVISLTDDPVLDSRADATTAAGWLPFTVPPAYSINSFNFTATDEDSIAMRLYDASSIGGASWFIDSIATVLPDNPDQAPPTTPIAFDFTGQSWQAIPEPATIGLMGIAGLGMFLARKKTRR